MLVSMWTTNFPYTTNWEYCYFGLNDLKPEKQKEQFSVLSATTKLKTSIHWKIIEMAGFSSSIN